MTKSQCCLLVEDDPEDQELFLEALHSMTSSVGCFAVNNGEEALLTLMHKDVMPDYIFTDLNMPKMNGLELLEALRGFEKFRSIPVIVFSSNCSDDVVRQAMQLGARAVYSKNRFGMVVEVIRKYFPEASSRATLL